MGDLDLMSDKSTSVLDPLQVGERNDKINSETIICTATHLQVGERNDKESPLAGVNIYN